jgi:NUMOD1 domain
MSRSGESNPFFRKTHYPETITLMSVAKGTAIYAYDLQDSLVYTFSSANKAAKYFNCCHKTILRNSIKGVIFQDKWILSTSFIIKE